MIIESQNGLDNLDSLIEALETQFSTLSLPPGSPSAVAPQTNTCTVGCTRNLCDDTDGCTSFCTITCTHGC